MSAPSRVVFMGSPDFAVPTLEALVVDRRFDVIAVATQPDRPKGRGRSLAPTPVKEAAINYGIPAYTMMKANYDEVVLEVAALKPDFVVVAAFGVILKDDLLSLPVYGCVNLHASILPKYRGVSPIQASILSGDEESGCTTMMMDAGIDTGDMLQVVRTPIDDKDTAGSLEARLAKLGAPLVVETLVGLRNHEIKPVKQNDAEATYTKKIRKKHGRINWAKPAGEIWRRIRAMSPWPTAFAELDGRRFIVVEASVVRHDVARSTPGRICQRGPLWVETGDGALEIHRVKVAGKKEMSAADFVSGYRLKEGDVFGNGV